MNWLRLRNFGRNGPVSLLSGCLYVSCHYVFVIQEKALAPEVGHVSSSRPAITNFAVPIYTTVRQSQHHQVAIRVADSSRPSFGRKFAFDAAGRSDRPATDDSLLIHSRRGVVMVSMSALAEHQSFVARSLSGCSGSLAAGAEHGQI